LAASVKWPTSGLTNRQKNAYIWLTFLL